MRGRGEGREGCFWRGWGGRVFGRGGRRFFFAEGGGRRGCFYWRVFFCLERGFGLERVRGVVVVVGRGGERGEGVVEGRVLWRRREGFVEGGGEGGGGRKGLWREEGVCGVFWGGGGGGCGGRKGVRGGVFGLSCEAPAVIRERRKTENWGGIGKKKREILGHPPFGASTLWGTTLWGSGMVGPKTKTPILAKVGPSKMVKSLARIGRNVRVSMLDFCP